MNQFNPTSLPVIANLAGLNNSPNTKIELELKDAYTLVDILSGNLDQSNMSISDCQVINHLIKKLRNCEPEEF